MRILYARSLVPLMSSIGSAWKCDVDSKLVVRNMKPSFFSNNLLLGLTLLLFVGSLSSFFPISYYSVSHYFSLWALSFVCVRVVSSCACSHAVNSS